jgi:hypothetical protein
MLYLPFLFNAYHWCFVYKDIRVELNKYHQFVLRCQSSIFEFHKFIYFFFNFLFVLNHSYCTRTSYCTTCIYYYYYYIFLVKIS